MRFDPRLIPVSPDISFETALWQSDVYHLAGIDEAGRGALAGPVAVGAVVLPRDEPELLNILHGVRDSKQMTPRQREQWAEVIKQECVSWAVGFCQAEEIDAIGIIRAVGTAAKRAIGLLAHQPQHLLVDYMHLKEISLPQTALVKGDARVLSIACASVLAKTARDALMVGLDADFPGYNFGRHKGYGTKVHLMAIAEIGACSQHRMSFRPFR